LFFCLTTDQRIDAALSRLFVQIDAIGLKGLRALLVAFLALFVLLGATHRLLLRHARALGDSMTDVTHGIEPRHILFLQEINRVAFSLSKERNKHIGARNFVAAGILDV
jgi:hypothetical protein